MCHHRATRSSEASHSLAWRWTHSIVVRSTHARRTIGHTPRCFSFAILPDCEIAASRDRPKTKANHRKCRFARHQLGMYNHRATVDAGKMEDCNTHRRLFLAFPTVPAGLPRSAFEHTLPYPRRFVPQPPRPPPHSLSSFQSHARKSRFHRRSAHFSFPRFQDLANHDDINAQFDQDVLSSQG